MNFISFSLYGNNPRYLRPALFVKDDIEKYFPGWSAVFYVDSQVPSSYIDKLRDFSTVIYVEESAAETNAMLWRYRAINLPNAERVLFRDADSRLSLREAEAVNEWINSGATLHIMRDHPFHIYKILGGMLGLTINDEIRSIANDFQSINSEYGEDIRIVSDLLYERYVDSRVIHASFHRIETDCKWFPQKYSWKFVGEVDRTGVEKQILRLFRILSYFFPPLVRWKMKAEL